MIMFRHTPDYGTGQCETASTPTGLTLLQEMSMSDYRVLGSSAWQRDEIETYLARTVIPIRLAAVDADDTPVVMSLWFVFDNGTIWCATQQTARFAKLLQARPRVGFEIAGDQPPYHGVRGQGEVDLSSGDGAATLERLIDRYLGSRDSGLARWLLARSETEVALCIRPAWITAWDYRQRMQAAVGSPEG
jgi:uncharacterized protein YhbP (UPF0306 family)